MMYDYGAPVEWYWQGKTEELKENLSHCLFVQHKSHMDWCGRERSIDYSDIFLWFYSLFQGKW
jgi:hypothetical protein